MNSEDKFKDSLRKLVESKDFPFDAANWEKAQDMNRENEFKDSLRNVVESKDFAFDESNWDKADNVLHPERAWRRPFAWSLAAMLLIFSGILAYYYIQPPAQPMAQHKENHKQPTPAISALPADGSPAAHGKDPVAAPNTATPASITADATQSSEEPAAPSNQKPTAGSFTSSSQKTKPVVISAPALIPPVVQHHQEPEHASAPETPAVPAKTAHDAKTADAVNTNVPPATSPAAPTVNPVTEQTQSEVKEKPAKQLPETPADIAAAQKEMTDNTAQNNTDAEPPAQAADSNIENKLPVNGDEPAKTEAPPVAQTNIVAPQEDATPLKSEGSNDQGKPAQLPALKPDSLKAVAAVDTVPSPRRHEKILMSFEIGADYLTGWNNPGHTDARGFNPVVGFNYFNHLTDKLAISLGAQYTTVNQLDYSSHISKTTRYNLGEENSVTLITPQKLHYLTIPVKLNYKINNNNAIGLGCNFSYLLTVDSKEETYVERLNRRDDYKSFKTTGYTEGFAAFDTQLSVFYRRKVYKNVSLNLEAVYGLTDIKNNAFFNSNVVERNTGLKLTLVYNVFKQK